MPRCKSCKDKFEPKEFLQKFCKGSIDCLTAEGLYKLDKHKKQRDKEWKIEKMVLEEKLKTKSDYEKDLQVPINKIARLIDKGSNCMMCNHVMKRTNGCHYHSRGANATIKFHLHNIWIGCHKCNGVLGGNIIGYDNRLIDVYGREKWEYVKFSLCQIQPIHLDKDELKELTSQANKIVKQLVKLDLTYSIDNRWKLREKINKQLGIYIK